MCLCFCGCAHVYARDRECLCVCTCLHALMHLHVNMHIWTWYSGCKPSDKLYYGIVVQMCLISPITNLNNINTIVLYTIFCMLLLLKNNKQIMWCKKTDSNKYKVKNIKLYQRKKGQQKKKVKVTGEWFHKYTNDKFT